jgi:hypothetical protein
MMVALYRDVITDLYDETLMYFVNSYRYKHEITVWERIKLI